MTFWENVWKQVARELPSREPLPKTWGSFFGAVLTAGLLIAIWFPIRLIHELLRAIDFSEKSDHRAEAQALFREAYDRSRDVPSKAEFAISVLAPLTLPGPLRVLAANHWTCAIENSGANYPDIEHLIGDLAIADPSGLPAIVNDARRCSPLSSGPRNNLYLSELYGRVSEGGAAVARGGPPGGRTGAAIAACASLGSPSCCGREVLVQHLGGGSPAERLARPAVQGGGDRGEFVGAVAGEVGPFREVLAQQAVGVLVGAALPGALRVAEVDRQAGVDRAAGRGGPSRRPGPRSASGAAARAASRSRRRSRRAPPRPRARRAAGPFFTLGPVARASAAGAAAS